MKDLNKGDSHFVEFIDALLYKCNKADVMEGWTDVTESDKDKLIKALVSDGDFSEILNAFTFSDNWRKEIKQQEIIAQADKKAAGIKNAKEEAERKLVELKEEYERKLAAEIQNTKEAARLAVEEASLNA